MSNTPGVSDANRTLFTVIYALDKPGPKAGEERMKYMQEHLAYIENIIDKVMIAGPIFADDQKTVIGSMLVYKTDDPSIARGYLEADPYFKADIWGDLQIRTFRGALGDAVGGKAY